MLKYLVARLLNTSKNTYYFLFILTKKVVFHRSPKTLLAKNNSPISVVMSRHDLACCGMNWKSGFWPAMACCSMNGACCGMPASGFWLEGLMLRHGKTMPRHALMICPILLFLTPFCYSLLVLRSFHLNITYKIKTNIKMPKTGDKQYKTLSIYISDSYQLPHT